MTETSKNKEKTAKYGDSYLFRAEVDKNGAVVRGTMDKVSNRVFLSIDTREPQKEGKTEKDKKPNLVPWCTDEKGLIYTITTQVTDGSRLVRGDCPSEMPFIFPP
ncbi:hypothetical protein, partial [uncultured Cohaesibacter sp.]|uniref:hypothetical protein n=1 Tax=uncultured Cohaesibacter sp. TaxID=1002546 RepID=UPI00292E4CB8